MHEFKTKVLDSKWCAHVPMFIKTTPKWNKDKIRNKRGEGGDVTTTICVTSRENLSSEVCDQVRLKPACSASEASKGLGVVHTAIFLILLSKMQTTKAQIILQGCAYFITQLLLTFLWHGSFPFTKSLKPCVTWIPPITWPPKTL